MGGLDAPTLGRTSTELPYQENSGCLIKKFQLKKAAKNPIPLRDGDGQPAFVQMKHFRAQFLPRRYLLPYNTPDFRRGGFDRREGVWKWGEIIRKPEAEMAELQKQQEKDQAADMEALIEHQDYPLSGRTALQLMLSDKACPERRVGLARTQLCAIRALRVLVDAMDAFELAAGKDPLKKGASEASKLRQVFFHLQRTVLRDAKAKLVAPKNLRMMNGLNTQPLWLARGRDLETLSLIMRKQDEMDSVQTKSRKKNTVLYTSKQRKRINFVLPSQPRIAWTPTLNAMDKVAESLGDGQTADARARREQDQRALAMVIKWLDELGGGSTLNSGETNKVEGLSRNFGPEMISRYSRNLVMQNGGPKVMKAWKDFGAGVVNDPVFMKVFGDVRSPYRIEELLSLEADTLFVCSILNATLMILSRPEIFDKTLSRTVDTPGVLFEMYCHNVLESMLRGLRSKPELFEFVVSLPNTYNADLTKIRKARLDPDWIKEERAKYSWNAKQWRKLRVGHIQSKDGKVHTEYNY